MRTPFLTIVIIVVFALAGKAQSLANLEADMARIAPAILKGKTDSERVANNNAFILLLEKAFKDEQSYEYPFDSLKTISRLEPKDKAFRIFTWNMPKDDGTYTYFGYVQLKDKKSGAYKLIKLVDKSDEIQSPETKALSPKNWYGTHYYSIVETTYKKTKYYTLLGIDWNNRITHKKIVDVLSIDKNGAVWFGDNIFQYNKKSPKRIIFEYSAEAVMSLKFYEAGQMIKYDHLSPMKDELGGQFQFYGPDFSYDALKFKKGKWIEVQDIDARNQKTPEDNIKRPKPDMGLKRGDGGNRDTQ